MTLSKVYNSLSPVLSNNSKVVALDTTLQQSLVNFKELLQDIERLNIELESYKNKFLTQREKCESKKCPGSEALKLDIACKDNIIQLVASSLTQLQESKDLSLLSGIFKILCNDTTDVPLASIKKENTNSDNYKINMILSPMKELSKVKTPKKECSSKEESSKDDSVSEIDGTPTGRTSPIIHSKIAKNGGFVAKSSDVRDKKKCPDNWPTPENKTMKLTFPPTPTRNKPNVRIRQGRLNVVMMKQSSLVDLTSSPEFAGGTRSGSASKCNVQPLVKKESVESDDTILPSPTSGPTNFTLLKSTLSETPTKFKKPLLSLKVKAEKVSPTYTNNNENSPMEDVTHMPETQNSIILNKLTTRLNSPMKHSPIKMEPPIDDDVTHCEIDSSMSLLRHVNLLEKKEQITNSPCKRPLEENINITNMPNAHETESSMSLLRPEPKINKMADTVKRRIPELVEPIYKEPTVRKKSEKRALKGWSCDECQNFYGELYKDDPEMLAKKIEECSKHRGRNNPARPKTPPGFWNPRKIVPESTEELNRLNNVD